jgi:hypothetical protein
MDMHILSASMTYSKEDGYVGKVTFEVKGHREPYEITLHSKHKRDWSYGLFFLKESGIEDEIMAVEDWLEEDDDAYDALIQAALDALPQAQG